LRREAVFQEQGRLGEMELEDPNVPMPPLPTDYIKFDWKTIYDETREDWFQG
jgi:hypothetical protein